MEVTTIFYTLLRIINSEIASGRCDKEILEASEVLFKANESFFRNHRVDLPDKKKKEDEKKEEDNKEEEEKPDQPMTPTKDNPEVAGDEQNWGNQDENTESNQEVTGWGVDDPEIAGHDKAIGAQNQDLPANSPEKIIATVDNPRIMPSITQVDDTTAIEGREDPDKSGNQADDEGEDQSKYFGDADVYDQDTNFTPDTNYHYEFNEEFQCMIYSGPDFIEGDLVDVMKTDRDVMSESISCWEQAQIIEDNPSSYTIRFVRENPDYTKVIQKDAYRAMLFKLETHTRKNVWRYWPNEKQLNIMVEVYHEGRWNLGRIQACMESMNGEVDMAMIQTFPDPDNLEDTSKSEYPQISIRSPSLRLPNGKYPKIKI